MTNISIRSESAKPYKRFGPRYQLPEFVFLYSDSGEFCVKLEFYEIMIESRGEERFLSFPGDA